MFIRKTHLSRRTMLRVAGAAVALPFLDAMVPAATALAQTAAAPRPRMGFFYLPHGAIMDRWTPASEGSDFELSPILEPLAAHRSRLTVVSGLGNKPAESTAVHAITPGTWLGCVPPRRSHAPLGGTTVDQIAAAAIGQDTPLPSIEAAVEESGGTAACDGTYGCSFGNTISFRTPTTPLPMEFSPKKLYQRLFGRGGSDAERAEIASDFKSVLDMVAEEAGDLSLTLGADDRRKLGDYLESVREIERRIEKLDQQDIGDYGLPELPVGIPPLDEHIRLMFDMIAVAYQANVTRVASFMMAAEVSNRAYTHIGVPDAFHPLSHHNNNPASIEKLVQIQRYHSAVFAEFLDKLAAMQDGERSVLDNSIFLYGCNMSDGNRHDHFPLPLLVAGRGGGVKGGQHLRYPDRTPIANLHVSLLQRAGIETESFGDSTGDFSEI